MLSSTDLKICGLAVTIELELNGVNRLRPSLGKPSPAEAKQKARADERRARRQAKKAAREVENTPQSPSATVLEKKDQPPSAENHEEWQQVGSGKAAKVVQDDGDDSDAGEWITPENVKQHKAKALGINPTEVPGEASSEAAQETEAFKTAACLTGDYAMQNVLLQIGITALGPDGMRVKQVRTWVLRCHACFK